MEFDDLDARRRQLGELQGIASRFSSLGGAFESTRSLADRFGTTPGSAIRDALTETQSLAERIAAARPSGLDGLLASDAISVAARGGIADQLRAQGAFSTSLFGGGIGAIAEAAQGRSAGAIDRFSEAGFASSGASEIARRYNAQMRELQDMSDRIAGVGGIASLAGRLGESDLMRTARLIERSEASAIARAARWATALDRSGDIGFASLFDRSGGVAAQLDMLGRTATGIVEAGGLADRASRLARGAIGETTALKFATYAGSIDLFGPRSAAGQAAFESLLGEWRTPPDLAPAFFRDPAERARRYRDADVDEGLIDADNAEVIEVLVETGVVEGERTARGVRAIVDIGPVRMAVTARYARYHAFRAIDAFEGRLRAFIAAKLSAHLAARGEDARTWFTARVPGNLVGAAKAMRREAYRAGEPKQPLINFTNLGDLIAVITTRQNWDEVFGAVFDDRDGTKVDLQRLNAHRRPTMHGRPIDAPRLVEIMLTVRRLTALIEANGKLTDGWDDDI